jgi:hypothetical protein
MANFMDILNQPADDIKVPQALPTGTYLCIIDGQPEITKVGKKETDAVIFSFKPVQPTEDVDQQALQTALDGSALADKKIRYTMWGTPDAAYRIKNFLVDHLGIPSTSLGQMIPQAMGKQVLVNIGHRTDGNPPQIYMDVKSTAKA